MSDFTDAAFWGALLQIIGALLLVCIGIQLLLPEEEEASARCTET